MDVLSDIQRRIFKKPCDVVGLDISADDTKAVRLRMESKTIRFVDAGILLGVTLPPVDEAPVEPLKLPKPLAGHYAALAVAAPGALIKLLNIPGRFTEAEEQRLAVNLGVEQEEDYRIGYHVLSESKAARETRLLAAALPDSDAVSAVALLPKGRPAPYCLEIAGLAALNGFFHGAGVAKSGKTVGILHGGSNQTMFAVFLKGQPVLVRRFDFGGQTIIAKIGEKLGADANTVKGFMNDGSFDVTAILQQSLEFFFKQIVISKEFVERRENCRLSEIMISGTFGTVRGLDETLKHLLGMDVKKWNPFSSLDVAVTNLPDTVAGNESLFAAAFGAAMAPWINES